ncbi:MAG: hypothetical protein JRG96_15395 [Deltaproteobacteria bacterium]|nr:hypothetical protein [Deltaproteobacteria bacterium]
MTLEGKLKQREQAFESVFFSRLNAERIEKLHQARERKEARQALARATGISETQVLDEILDLGVDPQTLKALSLVPLVCVAWADGELDDKERAAALEAAEAEGVCRDSGSYQLFEAWLARPPGVAGGPLLQAWKDYTVALLGFLGDEAREALGRDMLERAREVARATGGLLGLGRRISDEEQAVLDELEAVFG